MIVLPEIALPVVADERDWPSTDLLHQSHKLEEVLGFLAILKVDSPNDVIAKKMRSPALKRDM